MTKTTFTELRKYAKSYFDKVEKGETIQVIRHGKVIAEIVPPLSEKATPHWKIPIKPLTVPGLSISREIIKDRRKARA